MTEQQWRYEFAFRLNKMMDKKGYKTQKQLAMDAGIEEDTLSKYLNKERRPRIDILIAICDALGCSIDCLTRFDENRLMSIDYMKNDGIWHD